MKVFYSNISGSITPRKSRKKRSMTLSKGSQLVEQRGSEPITTSVTVAAVFNRKHKHVLDAIQRLINILPRERRPIFRPSSYLNDQGKSQRMFEMNRDGFSLLAMGVTGPKALLFKLNFIDAFNHMEDVLRNQRNASLAQARTEGKFVRKELTDTIADFVDYATSQGSHNSEYYFQNFTNMTYKALDLFRGRSPHFRDKLDIKGVSFLSAAELIAHQALLDGMAEQLYYKDIYQLARNRVAAFAATLPLSHQITP